MAGNHNIICLGNPNPRNYRNNPTPPEGATLAQCLAFAAALGVDMSGRLVEGQEVREKSREQMESGNATSNEAGEGQLLYVVTAQHELYSVREILAKPVEIPYFGPKTRLKGRFSPDSTLSQCIAECKTGWAHNSKDPAPAWISGTDPFLVRVIAEEFGITEIRPYEEDGQ